MSRYLDFLENVDASVFSGELLETNLEEFREYVARWNRAIESQDKLNKERKDEEERDK